MISLEIPRETADFPFLSFTAPSLLGQERRRDILYISRAIVPSLTNSHRRTTGEETRVWRVTVKQRSCRRGNKSPPRNTRRFDRNPSPGKASTSRTAIDHHRVFSSSWRIGKIIKMNIVFKQNKKTKSVLRVFSRDLDRGVFAVELQNTTHRVLSVGGNSKFWSFVQM